MADELTGRVALVTGSAQGLGHVIAEALAKQGCRVLINCAHSPEKAEKVCAELRSRELSADTLICDITDEAEVRRKIGGMEIDILVNNARQDPYKRPEGMSDGAWFNHLLNVNLTGAYLCAQAVKEGMKRRRWGRILNVSSVQAHIGMEERLLPYAVSKAGMHALTRCLALELGEFGITVNTLAPGMVETENIRNRLSDEEIKRKLQRFPLHRAATAEEVAEAAVHTLRSGAMTGETVNINSGVYFAP